MEQAYRAEDFQLCKSLAEKVLQQRPDNINGLRGYAFSCFMLEEYETAIPYLLNALEYSDEREMEYTYLGWCFCNLNNHIKACEIFEKAIEVNPLYEPALEGRTNAYIHLHADRLENVDMLNKKLES